MAKLFFHILNILFFIVYLYPGSIPGLLLYGNINKQPQLTEDFIFSFSENPSPSIMVSSTIEFDDLDSAFSWLAKIFR